MGWVFILSNVVIHEIINTIFVPSELSTVRRHGQVTPIPKTKNLKGLSDLIPINNLCAFSKLTKKIMMEQFSEYLNQKEILPIVQSWFWAGYNYTAVLFHLTDEIVRDGDEMKCTVWVWRDFIKICDTINHKILLKCVLDCFF